MLFKRGGYSLTEYSFSFPFSPSFIVSSPASQAFLSFILPTLSIKMIRATIVALLSVGTVIAAPILPRDVVLDPVATAQAQVRDNTATRAFSTAQIQSNGQCLTIDPNSGDNRENLIPVTIQACNGSTGQQWDLITAGVHNNVPGTALFVSSLTQGCLNLDTRRAVGQQVFLFSCGGRADGSTSFGIRSLYHKH